MLSPSEQLLSSFTIISKYIPSPRGQRSGTHLFTIVKSVESLSSGLADYAEFTSQKSFSPSSGDKGEGSDWGRSHSYYRITSIDFLPSFPRRLFLGGSFLVPQVLQGDWMVSMVPVDRETAFEGRR